MNGRKLIVGLVGAASVFAVGAVAATDRRPVTPVGTFGLESDSPVDLTELKCSDMVELNETDRGFAMVLLYGYIRGESTKPQLSARDVQVAVVNTTYECVDKPDVKALDLLKTHVRS